MKALAALLSISLLWSGCATQVPMPAAAPLFHDELFAAPATRVDPAAALAPSAAMRQFLVGRPIGRAPSGDRARLLIDALYRGELKLDYDAQTTRTAAETFEARAGNCLALVLMTASFAKELGLTVRYQAVVGETAWDRSDELYIGVGHVNLVLEEAQSSWARAFPPRQWVVDFLPPRDARSLETREIAEPTVIAMFLNNRAVEALTRGHAADAYWAARAAIATDPQVLSPYLTLGVIYRAEHRPEWAEAAFARVLEREPDNVDAISNRVLALRDLGRGAEADALAQRLARLDPNPPFSYFHQGIAAFKEGRFQAARRWFEKELERAPYHHEFEYWLAVTFMQLNDAERAAVHLRRAMEVSTTRKDHDLYAGKLDRLKALRAQ